MLDETNEPVAPEAPSRAHGRRGSAITVEKSVGRPARVSLLAELLLEIMHEPVLHLVHEQPREPQEEPPRE